MKLTDIERTKKVVQESILIEKLGTLAQLGVGPLINILKQPTGSGRKGEWTGEVGKKFVSQKIGSTSEILDLGPIKDGIKSIRKAYKTHDTADAFALYIGGKPVLFAIYNDYDLAGASRTGTLAYDLTAFKDTIDAMDAEAQAGKSEYERRFGSAQATKVATYREKERSSWEIERGRKGPERYQGEVVQTRDLAAKIDLIMNIAKRVGQPVTAKLVLADIAASKKRQQRFSNKQIEAGAKDLKTRLAIYKNMKKPTADTIEDFIKMSLNKPGSKVRFAGTTYLLKSDSYGAEKLKVEELLAGKPFTASYSSSDPEVYDSLNIVYAFSPSNNQLLPIYATWYDRTDPANRYKRQEGVLDPTGYIKVKLGVKNLEDKEKIIKSLLEKFKASQYYDVLLLVDSLKKAGVDWPELDAVQKSATIEYERKKNA